MKATAPRNYVSYDTEDDFWGQAPAAVSQPAVAEQRQVLVQGQPHGAERYQPKAHLPANDAFPVRHHPAAASEAIFLGNPPAAEASGQGDRKVLRRGAVAAASAAMLLTLGAAAVLSWPEAEPAGAAPTPELVAEASAAPVSTSAAETASGADLNALKAKELKKAAKAEGVQEPSQTGTAMAPTVSEPAQPKPDQASAAPSADAQPSLQASAASVMPDAQPEGIGSDAVAVPEPGSATGDVQPDEMETAALRPADSFAPLGAAGTPQATAASQGAELQVEAGIEQTDAATAPSEIELLAETATKTTVKKWVNMRTGPADDAATITIIPAEAEIGLISCDGWCHVIYEGQQGWVYKNFIRGAEELTAKKS